MKVDGACHCGNIAFEAEIDLADVRICHCSDCQTLSGSAFRTVVFARPGNFTLLRGTPRIYVKVSESGNDREQAFCENCGTPIFAAAPGPEPKAHGIRAGTIRQRGQLVPMAQIWTRSEQHWLHQIPSLPKIEKQPG